MTYVFLLLFTIALAFISYKKFENDILSPTVISCLMFSFCIFMATLGLFTWNNINNLSTKFIFIITAGLISFFIGELLARKNKKSKKIATINFKTMHIKKWQYFLTIIGILLTITLLILEIKRICNFYGFYSNSLPELLAFYRTKIGLFSTDLVKDGVDINFIVKQMKKVCDVLCVIFGYILINNIFSKDKIKNILIIAFPVLLTMLMTLLGSGRSILIHMIVAMFMMFFILYKKKNTENNISKKIITIGLGGAIATLAIFCLVLPLVGRKVVGNTFDYITFYIGTPIPSFQLFLDNPPLPAEFGSETFSGVYYVLDKIGIINHLQIGSHEWVRFGQYSSNVYMSLRRYYYDFGIVGVILCQFIFGFVISKIYLYIMRKNNLPVFLIYGYFSYILVDQIRDEQFFGLLNSSTIAYVLIILTLYWFYFKFEPKKIFKTIEEKRNEKIVKYSKANKTK